MRSITILILLLAALQTSNTQYFSHFVDRCYEAIGLESCDDYFIEPNFEGLESHLNKALFGQHIIINSLIPALKSHFHSEPRKALVIGMNGWTGSGKNYVTQMIVDSIYRKKSDSQFVRFFNGRLHFPLSKKEYVDEYVTDIQAKIKNQVSKCARSLFVFDEVDKIPGGVLDGIKPYLDYHRQIDSVDYSKSIFIFISNIGGGEINTKFNELWKQGTLRSEMRYVDFESHLRRALYKEGGFEKSSILDGHLVTLYLPFLPMMEKEVRQCIVAEMKRQSMDHRREDLINRIIDYIEFNADGISVSGCKKVGDVVSGVKYSHSDEL